MVHTQIIRGTDLRLRQDLSELKGFGTSLASGVDVDLNGYNGKEMWDGLHYIITLCCCRSTYRIISITESLLAEV